MSSQRTRIPDFDRPVARSGDNLGPIRGKGDRVDFAAVGGGLLCYTVDEHRDHPVNKREEERGSEAHGVERREADWSAATPACEKPRS